MLLTTLATAKFVTKRPPAAGDAGALRCTSSVLSAVQKLLERGGENRAGWQLAAAAGAPTLLAALLLVSWRGGSCAAAGARGSTIPLHYCPLHC